MKDPIIVCGAPRSGTTLTMRFLHRNGMQVGKQAESNSLMEGPIRDMFYKPVLSEGGFDPLAQESLPPVRWCPEFISGEQAREQIMKLIGVENFNRPWGFKAVKGLLFWRLLDKAFPEAKWILIFREKEEHISSLLRTPFMRVHETRAGWSGYIDQVWEHATDLLNSKRPWPVGPVRTFRPAVFREGGKQDQLQSLAEWCGLHWNAQSVSVFNPELYRK